MKRLRHTILRTAASILALMLTIIAAALIFTGTARFNGFLRTQIVSYLTQTYRASISIGRIEGSVWGSLTLHDIEVRHAGATIASIPQLRLGYRILPALRGEIVLSDIDVLKPDLTLARDPDGQWNLLAAFTERQPSPPSISTIALHRFSIEQARATVTTAPLVTYHLTGVNIAGTGYIAPSGAAFTLDTIGFALSGPRLPPLRAQGAAQYNEAQQVAAIEIPRFSIRTDRSHLEFSGTLRDFSAKNIDAAVNLRKLAAADVDFFAPRAYLARDVSGTIRISAKASDLHAALALDAGTARLEAAVQADIARPEFAWKIDSQLANANLRELFKRTMPQQLPAGIVRATAHAAGSGFSLANVKGAIDVHIAGLGAQGLSLGDLTAAAAVEHRTASLNALLAGAGGRARIAGQINIAKVPAYNLTVVLDHLRPANVANLGAIPPADLNLAASVEGSGYQPNTMRTRVRLTLQPSTVHAIRIDSGRLEAQIASGTMRIAAASLKAADTIIDLNGVLALDSHRTGQLNYRIAAAQLSPWLGLIGQRGSGRVDLTGLAQGSLQAMRTTGTGELSALKVGSYQVAQARLAYDLSGLGTRLRPAGQATLLASSLRAGIELKSLRTSVLLRPGTPLRADVDITAQDPASHTATVRAEISYKPGLTILDLTTLTIATSHGQWQLRAAAQLVQQAGRIELRRFAAFNQDQTVVLNGALSRSGPQDLTMHVEHLRLGDFAQWLPAQLRLAGLASSDLTVRGSAAAPVLTMSTSISQLNLAGIPQAGFTVQFSYANGRAQAQAKLVQDPAHSLTATAALPFNLSWARDFEARPTGDMELRAVSGGLDLAVLNAFRNPQLRDLHGVLSLDVTARGPLTHPQPQGFIRLSNVHATAPKLKVALSEGSAYIQLQAGEVRLVSLSARAGDGTLTGAGAMTLTPEGRPGNLDLRLALDRWPAIATHQYNATVAAHLNSAGPFNAPQVGGRIEVLYGVFRPDLSVTGSAPRPDATIVVVHQWTENPQPPRPQRATATLPVFRDLAIDVDVVIDRDTWIKTADIAVEMEGQVHIHKRRGGEPIVYGTINTVRGTLVVAGRQFDLTRGQITFTGGHEINPELLIVAQRQVASYTVAATVGGTAAKPTLTLSSSPELPQADILSVMMFGKTTNDLNANQQKDLQNQAIAIAGGYAASQIGQAVAQSLGLSSLGVTASSSGVGLGRYITSNIYVSATQSAANMRDRRAEVQYYITPHLNLNTSASTNYGNEIKLQWHKDY